VAYRLIDPEAVTHSHVLVVGGGDSALEAACSLAESSGNRVTVAHRSGSFSRAKARNRERLEALVERGKIFVRFDTTVRTIGRDRVVLNSGGGGVVLPNDEIYVFTGGVLPTAFLLAAGLRVERHFGGRVEVVEKAGR